MPLFTNLSGITIDGFVKSLPPLAGLRYASSFVIATYCKYASFLKLRKLPCRKRHLGRAGFCGAQLAFGAFYFAVRLLTFTDLSLLNLAKETSKDSGCQGASLDQNPPSNMDIFFQIKWFGIIPDHQQGIRCKAPRSDD